MNPKWKPPVFWKKFHGCQFKNLNNMCLIGSFATLAVTINSGFYSLSFFLEFMKSPFLAKIETFQVDKTLKF